jgi:Protein of unknown function (DUF1579)
MLPKTRGGEVAPSSDQRHDVDMLVDRRKTNRRTGLVKATCTSLVCALGFCVADVPTWADERPSGPPPELERLAWLVGTWETRAHYKLTTDADTFEADSIEDVRWANNQQFLISEQEGRMPDGWHAKLVVTGWESQKHRYKMVDIDLSGAVTEISLSMDNATMDILYYLKRGERYIRLEERITQVSDTAYKAQATCSEEEKTWICYDAVWKRRTPNSAK